VAGRKPKPGPLKGQEYQLVDVGLLKCQPDNPNVGDIDAIRESLRSNGWWGVCVVQRSTNHILVGNHRYQAAVLEGFAQVPVAWVDCDNDRASRILLADNRTGELAQRDDGKLAAMLAGLGGLKGTGYDDEALADLLSRVNPKEAKEAPEPQFDRAEELRAKYGVERGQVWTVGRHRILCGDSTDAGDVERLMDGAKAQMVFTDPPYGVGYDGGVTTVRDKLAGDEGTQLYPPCCRMAFKFSDAFAPLYIWHAGTEAAAAAAAAAGYDLRSILVWNKNQAQFGALSSQYKQKHELAYYCFKRGKVPRWFGPTNETTVWDCDRASVNEFHPTQKPPELAARAIGNSTEANHIVLDLFLGSGSTLCACEQTGRIGYGMEICEKYVAVALERLSGMGLVPELISGSATA